MFVGMFDVISISYLFNGCYFCSQNSLARTFRNQNLDEFKKVLVRTGLRSRNEKTKNYFWGLTTTRNILFERGLESDESLFEVILKTPGHGSGKFISLIWTEGELWKNQNILETVW